MTSDHGAAAPTSRLRRGAGRRLRRRPCRAPTSPAAPASLLHRRTFDVLVLGGGIAGLTAAIGAARRWRVGLLTKSTFDDTTTFLAQGGIAAALGPSDSPELHFQDTVNAGAGLCDEEAVRVLVNEGPDRVRELMDICPRFDKVDGQIVLGREGAHSVARVVHAGGDATGSEVSSALGRGGSRGQPRAALRERVRHRPAHRGGTLRRGAHAEPRRRRAHAQRGDGHRARHGRRRSGVRTHHQPAGRDRRRHRHGVPGRRRHPRPGVRAVPPDRARACPARRRCSSSPRRCAARARTCATRPASAS